MDDCSDDCVGVIFDVADHMKPTMDMGNWGWIVALIPVLAIFYKSVSVGFCFNIHLYGI